MQRINFQLDFKTNFQQFCLQSDDRDQNQQIYRFKLKIRMLIG